MENFIITDFSLETLLAQQLPQVSSICSDYGSLTSAALACDGPTAIPASRAATESAEHVLIETKKKRKEMEQSTCESQIRKKNRLGKVKKAKEEEEIIYVRASRGQATDSHSLAERVRREKINEKMRCLQDIVPGCHKTMGMAMMLEEITNYVHSLQNQVEFLSMELAAASSYDSNFGTEGIKNAQEGTNSQVAQQQQQNEKWAVDRYGEQHWFHSTWPL